MQIMQFRNKIEGFVKNLHVKRNVVNLNVHNSWQHELVKSRICYELKKLNKDFITEAPMYASGASKAYADILVLDDARVIEIMVSETIEQLEWKIRKYPKSLEIISVRNWEDYFNGNYRVIQIGGI